ncbi:MAG: hypothetical protein ACTSXK_18070 [Promethearchaeota archaeon]
MSKNKNLKKSSKFLAIILMGMLYISTSTSISANMGDSVGNFQDKINEPAVSYIGSKNVQSMNSRFSSANFPIFGYSLQVEKLHPMDLDENGKIFLSQKKELNKFNLANKDFLNISIQLKSGNYEFRNVHVNGSIFMDQDNHQMYTYDIEQSTSGFFMSMDIYSNITKIDLAFDGGDRQLCYKGYINRGYSSLNLYFTRGLEKYSVKGNEKSLLPQSKLSFEDDRQQMMNKAVNNLHIFKSEHKENSTHPKSAGFVTYKFGIVHNVAFGKNNGNDYFSWIDNEIYMYMSYTRQLYDYFFRDDPSESLVKSDLQYYNEDLFENGHGYKRDILLYTIYAHGMFGFSRRWQMEGSFHYLYPSEVRSLWYHHETNFGMDFKDVNPNNMIILAKVCWGLKSNQMADAFVDYGATAFAGNKNRDYAGPKWDIGAADPGFWLSLGSLHKNLRESCNNLVDAYNKYKKSSWPTWSHDDIKIVGDSQVSF